MSDETILSETESETPTTPDWRAGLPEELASHSAIQDISTIEDLAKATINAQKLVGADKIVLPGKEAEASAWDSVYNKLGRPEKADEYSVPEEGVSQEIVDQFKKSFSADAHRLGLTNQQFAGLARVVSEQAAATEKTVEEKKTATREEAIQQLREKFGAAYEQNVSLAKTAVERFGGKELMDKIASRGLGNDVEFIEAMSKIGRMVAQDEVVGGGGKQGFVMSPDEAKKEIDRKLADPDFRAAYFTGHHPGHSVAIEEMQNLYALAHE